MMSKHEKIPRRKRKTFYTNSYSKIRVKEDLIADKLQVSYWGVMPRALAWDFLGKISGKLSSFLHADKKACFTQHIKKHFFLN